MAPVRDKLFQPLVAQGFARTARAAATVDF